MFGGVRVPVFFTPNLVEEVVSESLETSVVVCKSILQRRLLMPDSDIDFCMTVVLVHVVSTAKQPIAHNVL
jgi:hypothetical protein